MKTLYTPFLLAGLLLLNSCGDNTTTSAIKELESLKINNSVKSIYATSPSTRLYATVNYSDGSESNLSDQFSWSSSDEVLFVSDSSILPTKNGGDANITVRYKSNLSDVAQFHVKELLSINFSDINISDVGTPQTLYFSGNFENNESNVTLTNNITWYSDENSTISDINATQLTITVDTNTTSVLLRAVLFTNTDNAVDFNKTYN